MTRGGQARSIAAGLVIASVAVWTLHETAEIILLFILALSLAIAINAPVAKLEQRGWRRGLAALVVLTGLALAAGLIGWLVVPRFATQLAAFLGDLPAYVQHANDRVADWLEQYPQAQRAVRDAAKKTVPDIAAIVTRAGRISLGVAEVVAIILVIVSIAMYAVFRPRPLLETYLRCFPEHSRERAARAFVDGAHMIVGWIWSHVVVGSMEAVASAIVLSMLHVPAAFVWAAFTFFAELIPRLGGYVMAVPPIIVAFSVSPLTALWVVVFYVVMNELMGNFVVPWVRGKTMVLHPAWLLFITLALAAAFGLVGALVATPLAGFIAAFWNAFRESPEAGAELVDRMIARGKVEQE